MLHSIYRIAAFFQQVKLADIADIGIIAIFIYLILVWVKKARARFTWADNKCDAYQLRTQSVARE